jgi:hypothetical protein
MAIQACDAEVCTRTAKWLEPDQQCGPFGLARTGLFASGPGGLISLASDFAALLVGQSAADGVRPILLAATSAKQNPGGYYGPGGIGELRGAPAPALIMPQARDTAKAARLWDVSEKLAETPFN